MSSNYTIERQNNGIIRATAHTDPNLEMAMEMVKDISGRDNSLLRLIDFRGTTVDLGMPAQQQVSAVIKRNDEHLVRTAFLVDNQLSLGRIRQYMSYREEENILREVFTDEDEAVAWLLEKTS
ncbi:MAG: hypothetical protein MRY76_06615 [Pseudomonadales bacterium]|nr:hypothetical protein [Pseudomonadales bacterium]